MGRIKRYIARKNFQADYFYSPIIARSHKAVMIIVFFGYIIYSINEARDLQTSIDYLVLVLYCSLEVFLVRVLLMLMSAIVEEINKVLAKLSQKYQQEYGDMNSGE